MGAVSPPVLGWLSAGPGHSNHEPFPAFRVLCSGARAPCSLLPRMPGAHPACNVLRLGLLGTVAQGCKPPRSDPGRKKGQGAPELLTCFLLGLLYLK